MKVFIIAFSIFALFYGYMGWRIIIPAGYAFPWNAVLWFVFALGMTLPFISIFFRIYEYSPKWIYIFNWIVFFSMGFFSLVFTFIVARDIVLLFSGGVQKLYALISGFFSPGIPVDDPVNPDRHRFLAHSLNMGIVGMSGLLSGYGLYEARKSPVVVNVDIPVHNLHADLAGFRIVQITDIHVGTTIKHNFVQTIVDKVNSLKPDVIAFTGDLADGMVANLREDVAPLAELSARYGSYFVTGNHEYYMGVEAWIGEVDRLGFSVLLNEHRIIHHGAGSILLAGVTDYNGGNFIKSHESSPHAALEGAPPDILKILLAHQPRSVFAASSAGYDLQISGHTHGGQYFPWNYFVHLQQPYTKGLHRHDTTWIYVSKGTGYWGPPIRIGVPSEITVFSLTET